TADIEVDPAITRLALVTAERLLAGELPAPPPETLPPDELSDRILPPVAFTAAAIDEGRRLVIGAGLNFAQHREEVGASDATSPSDSLLFPKATPPSPAYRPVATGTAIGSVPPRPVVLLDYEAEIGLVLLEEVDLRAPPVRSQLLRNSALVTVNDLSDRGPIIGDDVYGYTRGKSHPGYLPLGPWLVPAWHLDLAAGSDGQRPLAVGLAVTRKDADGQQVSTTRQSDRSTSMLHGPTRVLDELSRRYLAGEPLCMPDAWGRPRLLHDADGRIPAGSILLTGTPGGTALRSPGLTEKIRLFFEGGLTVSGARAELIEELETDAWAFGFLAPGDVVETWVEALGRQQWEVVATEADEVYGVPGSGGCDDFQSDEE
ncbi:MAG: fumarylacetoacetate hydrolase family protein, partial [Nitrospirota bacterium]|nr:fumarylacetoacetate hydrolase family protein [Nitrospirota bacterium]